MDEFGRLPDDVLKHICMMSLPITFELYKDDHYFLKMNALCFQQYIELSAHKCSIDSDDSDSDDDNILQNIEELNHFLEDPYQNQLNLLDYHSEFIVCCTHESVVIIYNVLSINLPVSCLPSLLSSLKEYREVICDKLVSH